MDTDNPSSSDKRAMLARILRELSLYFSLLNFEKASKVADYALILGEDEIKTNTVSVKNLATSTQKSVARVNIGSEIKNV